MYTQVTSYDGHSSAQTVTVAADSLLPAYIYKFKTRALNVYGYSDWSEELDAGVSSFPAQPSPLTKIAAETGPTYITVQWAKSPDTQLPVLGY